MLDIYPFERRGFAMAIWGVGVMLGPIMGPTVGGWLTENYNWRWVFYINLPFGLLAAAGLMIFLPSGGGQGRLRFDWLGFGVLTIGIGALQLMLDRGQDQDWFSSREIVVEAVLASLGCYLFLVHALSANQPMIRPALFRDVNFASGVLLMFMVGIFMVSSLALMTPWLQVLSQYPVETAGLIMAPRGLGSLVTTMMTGRVAGKIDARLLVGIGLVLLTYSYWLMTRWTPDVSEREIIIAIVIQGAAMGLLFTPIQVLAFVTLAPSMRTEGAALFSLLRNLGSAIGVSVAMSVLARNTQAMHEMIGAAVTPFNRSFAGGRAHASLARSGDAARRGIAGSAGEPSGADRRLCRRLRVADPGNRAGMAASADDAPAAAAGWRGGGISVARRCPRGAPTVEAVAAAMPDQAHAALAWNQQGRATVAGCGDNLFRGSIETWPAATSGRPMGRPESTGYSAARFGVNSSGNPLWPVSRSPSSYISKARFFNAGTTDGDLVQVQIGRDPRVAGTLDHRAELAVLDLLERPFQRIVDDRQVPVDAVVLVARTIVVMRTLPETVERQDLGLLHV